ncbi:MAG: prepilin-type N-terminal cleavage/methylation domain-containing protein [Clostridiaceae bacterium]|nr:prepilin-type N-terminal cleavage/methylation domain-containing protein [Clostridiaceae bacterium]
MKKYIRSLPLSNNHGFTLIELIVSMVILAIVLTMGFQIYHHVNNAFVQGEKQWVAQREAQKLIDWFDSNLKNSYELLIYENNSYDENSTFQNDDDYVYIYQTNDNKVYFRNSSEDSPQLLTEIPVKIEFSITPENDKPQKALDFSVTILDGSDTSIFALDSTVSLSNMLRSSGINRINGIVQTNTKNTGNMVKLLNDTSDLSSIEISSQHCFIATAAYGSYNHSSVVILRCFRDKFLLTNKPGQAFVRFYYKNSPFIARLIENSFVLKIIVSIALIPFVIFALLLLVPKLAIYIVFVLCFIWILKRFRRTLTQ